jgi:hypothetical protein
MLLNASGAMLLFDLLTGGHVVLPGICNSLVIKIWHTLADKLTFRFVTSVGTNP